MNVYVAIEVLSVLLLLATAYLAGRHQGRNECRFPARKHSWKAGTIADTLQILQEEHEAWRTHNFPIRPGMSEDEWRQHPLLGIVEEIGEVNKLVLKARQVIRGVAEDDREFKALLGAEMADPIIYLADAANRYGISLSDALYEKWQKVKTRDFKADPRTGVTHEEVRL